MADLGIYNYIQAALARGETKEQITATLLKGGQPQASIDDAFVGVQRGRAPSASEAIEDKPHGGGLFMNIVGTFAIIIVIAAIGLAFLVHAGVVRIPKPQELMAGAASCTQPDDCIREDINKIKAQAQELYDYTDGSYATLCADGIVNVYAATGTNPTAMNINASLRNAVNNILLTRSAPSQPDAGVSCGSAKDRYFVSATMREESEIPNYCVDSRGVATSSTPNTRTGFCGSVLSQI